MKKFLEKIKLTYNQWLFDKYGLDNASFGKIPYIYKSIPLWSPSLYAYCEGKYIASNIRAGIITSTKYKGETDD